MIKYLYIILLFQICFAQSTLFQSVSDDFYKEVQTSSLNDVELEKFSNVVNDIILTKPFNNSQFFLIIDRGKQNIFLAYYNDDTQSVLFTDPVKISTGSFKKEHFITPLGWFENSPKNGSFRAEGTLNENGIRGYGAKGMRVWDFGWQKAQKGWTKNIEFGEIRLQMHATDPALEQRFGTKDSKGCIRIPASMNKFIDERGIIDSEFEKNNYWALSKNRNPVQNSGSYILILDTN